MKTDYTINFLENASEILRSVAHPIRISIINLLSKEKQMSVTQIHGALKIEQATASHHLRILKDKNVVSMQRSGKNALYSLSHRDFAAIIDMMDVIL